MKETHRYTDAKHKHATGFWTNNTVLILVEWIGISNLQSTAWSMPEENH